MDVHVENDTENNRFKILLEDKEAFLEYKIAGKERIVFIHTEVPPELEGRGLANRLAHTGLEYAKEHNLVVVPFCPFVAAYIHRHREYAPLVMPGYKY